MEDPKNSPQSSSSPQVESSWRRMLKARVVSLAIYKEIKRYRQSLSEWDKSKLLIELIRINDASKGKNMDLLEGFKAEHLLEVLEDKAETPELKVMVAQLRHKVGRRMASAPAVVSGALPGGKAMASPEGKRMR